MTAAELSPSHPVAAAVSRVRAELHGVAETPLWSMNTTETEAALVAATELASQVAHLQLRLLAHAQRVEVGVAVGATSPANWLAHETRTTRAVVHRAARLADRLEDAHPNVASALAEAVVNVEQAQVIVDAVDALPTDLVDTTTIGKAEAFLLTEAGEHDAKALRVLGGGCWR